jgi:predicted RNA-binding protein with PUA-like domain
MAAKKATKKATRKPTEKPAKKVPAPATRRTKAAAATSKPRPAVWLVKSEPSVYPWSLLAAEGRTVWNGVRNFEARNHLRAMKLGDLALFYHSNEGKEIVGLTRVVREAYPDPTAPGEDWSVVDVAAERALARAIDLAELKANPILSKMQLVTRSRLSVTRVTHEELDEILRLSERPALVDPKKPAEKAPAKKAPAKKPAAKKAGATKKRAGR